VLALWGLALYIVPHPHARHHHPRAVVTASP